MTSASSWSWVTKTKVVPSRSWRFFTSTCISLRSFRSSAASGSSRSSTSGSSTTARARATRCFCPPESWSMRRRARSPSRTISSARATRASISARGDLRHLQAEGHVARHRAVGEERVVLEDGVDGTAMRRDGGHVAAGDEDAARFGRLEAGQQAQQRGLAAARRAQKRQELAGSHVERHAVHGDHVPIRLAHGLQADGSAHGMKVAIVDFKAT